MHKAAVGVVSEMIELVIGGMRDTDTRTIG